MDKEDLKKLNKEMLIDLLLKTNSALERMIEICKWQDLFRKTITELKNPNAQ